MPLGGFTLAEMRRGNTRMKVWSRHELSLTHLAKLFLLSKAWQRPQLRGARSRPTPEATEQSVRPSLAKTVTIGNTKIVTFHAPKIHGPFRNLLWMATVGWQGGRDSTDSYPQE